MGIISNFKRFIENSRHIMSISYKPNAPEFNKSAKIIIIGILLVGFIGFIMAIIISLLIAGNLSFI